MLAYRWIAQLGGLNPSAFHSVNLALHLLVSATAYLMFWHLTLITRISLSQRFFCIASDSYRGCCLDCFSSENLVAGCFFGRSGCFRRPDGDQPSEASEKKARGSPSGSQATR
jgi:hypothetical protein